MALLIVTTGPPACRKPHGANASLPVRLLPAAAHSERGGKRADCGHEARHGHRVTRAGEGLALV